MTSSALSVIVSCRSARGGILDPVVLPPEGDAALVHGEQPAVWDRDALRVARQVASTASRPANGRLARPLTLIGAAVRATADELQLAGPMTLHQCFEEAAGRKKLVLHAIQNLPSCADPPPRTAPCTCEWRGNADDTRRKQGDVWQGRCGLDGTIRNFSIGPDVLTTAASSQPTAPPISRMGVGYRHQSVPR